MAEPQPSKLVMRVRFPSPARSGLPCSRPFGALAGSLAISLGVQPPYPARRASPPDPLRRLRWQRLCPLRAPCLRLPSPVALAWVRAPCVPLCPCAPLRVPSVRFSGRALCGVGVLLLVACGWTVRVSGVAITIPPWKFVVGRFLSPGPVGGLGRPLCGGCGTRGPWSLLPGGGVTCWTRSPARWRGGLLSLTLPVRTGYSGLLTRPGTSTSLFPVLGWPGTVVWVGSTSGRSIR